ncbi:helix-turn-helix domain-containing protein [Enterobacter kobei]|uniref:helix-turn-helix domain-containing protein n=1 Tax=Enterobacter cloacae complex TaxID=354276 RepID=UPI0005E0104B|nr:helix-turn-helix domain-containing protein [Enterobacter kobei]KJI47849.1 cyclic nucleotide-binding protein [Enterobacter kobei]MBD3598579.1 helix-turn-helix domain-containing protein [Enterobacter kobei]MBG0587266.1 helix-turn-helix domain-containing protein [Enterobacter kobei]MCK6794670.1 helix-turn-helix domain-containing protein [Enterobacter kobei]MCK7021835.1 helix-turn-helix domain-containing protein [Enterobacter kobei]
MKAKFTIEHPAPVTSTTELKPVTRIQRIIDIVAPYAEDFSVSKGEVLRYSYNNKRVCYLLHEGHTTLYRRGDGMVLNSEQAPFIMGVSNMKARQEHLYGRATSDVKLSRIPSERFILLIERENLWEDLCYFILYTAGRVYQHCTMISQLSAYEIIRFHLVELMQEPERLRLNTTAATYILNRSYLSRSGTMRILSKLKEAGCITLNRGILIKINNLPQKY